MRIHDRWSAGKAARNAWQQLPGTYLSELQAASGAGVVTLDLQHGMMDLPDARDSILAIEARGATPFARLPGLDAMLIGRLLDSGTNRYRTASRPADFTIGPSSLLFCSQ